MSSDISKMFREVGLHTEEHDLHRYLTCSKETRQLEDWRMTRLTFGVTSSPFLATQVLKQVADDYHTEFQKAAEVVCRDFYVDDCLSTGVSSLQEATVIRESPNQLLGKVCMTLRKWRSNTRDLLATVPDHLKEKENIQLIAAPRECHKALGVHWHTVEDTLHVATPSLQRDNLPTKHQWCPTSLEHLTS